MNADSIAIRQVPAAEGWQWLKAGYRLFRAHPFVWMAQVLACGLVLFGLAHLPGPGQMAAPFVWPTLAAGFMFACRAQAQGQPPRLAFLFAGFRHSAIRRLLLLGALYLVASTTLLMFLVSRGIDLGAMVDNVMRLQGSSDATALATANRALQRGFVAELGAFLPLFMAVWFAPALIIFDDQPVGQALRLSFMSCFHNTVPFMLYAGALLLLSLIAAWPFGLGLVVLAPVVLTSSYASYCCIFERQQRAT